MPFAFDRTSSPSGPAQQVKETNQDTMATVPYHHQSWTTVTNIERIDHDSSVFPSPSSSKTDITNSTSRATTPEQKTLHLLLPLPDPLIFTGATNGTNICSDTTFKKWSVTILAKLDQMTATNVDERTKMEYVVNHTGGQAFRTLFDKFEDSRGKVAFGSAKPMVMYLAQYYDEDVRMIDLRFGCV